jgi:hypothetical protein
VTRCVYGPWLMKKSSNIWVKQWSKMLRAKSLLWWSPCLQRILWRSWWPCGRFGVFDYGTKGDTWRWIPKSVVHRFFCSKVPWWSLSNSETHISCLGHCSACNQSEMVSAFSGSDQGQRWWCSFQEYVLLRVYDSFQIQWRYLLCSFKSIGICICILLF